MKKNSGFTIVEISLVLGIAGLIMIMVFVALPSLWSSQRDADRRANVMNFISTLKTFQTNNSRGNLPTGTGDYEAKKPVTNYATDTWAGFLQDYYIKGESADDPSGHIYTIRVIDCAGLSSSCETSEFGINKEAVPNLDANNPIIYVVKSATCDGNAVIKSNSNRSVAVVQVLERGKYCQNT